MSAHAAVFARLNALASITGGVYPGYAPKSAALPYATFDRISDVPIRYQQGSCGPAEAIYQINVVAIGAAEAYVVSEAIRADLDGLQGSTVAGIQILRVSLTSERDTSTLFNGSQTETFEVQQDYTIFYTRTSTP
jgi:hypothetical protein